MNEEGGKAASGTSWTSWPSVLTNRGVNESIWLTRDLGETWVDVMGNLAQASSTVGLARPGGLLFVNVPPGPDDALLVGTVNGVFLSYLKNPGVWKQQARVLILLLRGVRDISALSLSVLVPFFFCA